MSRPNRRTEPFPGAASLYGAIAAALLLGAIAATIALYLLLRETKVEEPVISFAPVSFADIEGWRDDDQAAALQALLKSCGKIKRDSASAEACVAARDLAARGQVSREAARTFFETHYTPNRIVGAPNKGLVTGYYEPEIEGARAKSDKFSVAAYGRPDDLVSVRPDEMRAKDSAEGTLTAMRKTDDGLVPFYTREEIDKGALAGKGLELVYLDPVELFFMQVQGSGRVRLADGTHLRLGYATKNGHPYTSIGKKLVELGDDKPKSMTMQGIKEWLRADKDRGNKMMWENKSYVFFRLLDGKEGEDGPIGAQGVSLTPGRSLAVDPSFHALGLPVFVEAPEMKGDGAPFRRLMIAQDVGSAIKGVERGDIYWGSGDDAGAIAGKTLAPAEFIVLLPNAAPGV
ncbi:MAG TPA: MltA domain-containing protein [Methyloceanibacter sp.]|nr:MltA domain-containing protein [Methyloceanibacter sp.]